MPIQLDKILSDIANEKVLHPNIQGATKKEVDDAWARVGKNSNLSVHESRSIFKVLQKKYEQEKLKEASAWKLYSLMDQIHKKEEAQPEEKEDDANIPMEEDEEYEMLEVQEEDDGPGHPANSGESDNESPMKSNSSTGSPEKDEKPLIKTMTRSQTTPPNHGHETSSHASSAKVTNITPKGNNHQLSSPQTPTSATAAALQKKGITMKKTTQLSATHQQNRMSTANTNAKNNQGKARVAANAGALHSLEGKTIQLPDSLKRKLSEDHGSTTPSNKKMNQQHTPQSNRASPKASPQQQQHTTTAQLMQMKHERTLNQSADNTCALQDTSITGGNTGTGGINVITIPANPSAGLVNGLISTGVGGPSSSTAATVASTSTNGFSPRIEEIDFRNDIIFESATGGTAGNGKVATASDIINLGNFDNSLPPTFFKNLCNSSRHEALGLYVANVMNRLRPRSASKLEIGILKAILDVQSEELEQ